MELAPLMIVLIAMAAAFYFFKKRHGKIEQDIVIGHIKGPKMFNQEIVGESFYQDNLREIVHKSDSGKTPLMTEAVLRMENNNPHDNKAVGVYIGPKKVGHLSRETARLYRKTISANGFKEESFSVNAKVFGGTGEKSYGVWIDIELTE